jgi:hypothetical protein
VSYRRLHSFLNERNIFTCVNELSGVGETAPSDRPTQQWQYFGKERINDGFVQRHFGVVCVEELVSVGQAGLESICRTHLGSWQYELFVMILSDLTPYLLWKNDGISCGRDQSRGGGMS